MTDRRDGKPERRRRFHVMHLAAYFTVGGVAVAESMSMPADPGMARVIALLVLFQGLLAAGFMTSLAASSARFIAYASVLTVLAFGAMAWGSSPGLGGALFFVICSLVAWRLGFPAALAWDGLAALALYASLLLRGRGDEWRSDILPYVAGFFAVIAFTVTIRKAQEAGQRSQRLLVKLDEAQGRLRDLAVMEERQRLAREMHDAVGHRLTASAMLLEGASRLIPTEPERAAKIVETSREQVREALAELRTAVSALREDSGARLPLAETLRALVDVFARSTEAAASLEIGDSIPEPDTERKLALVRGAQEALTNASKHSGASSIALSLRFEEGAYLLECRDDGRGPPSTVAGPSGGGDEAGAAPGGYGLGNLRARAAAFGGGVELSSAEGGGAVLTLRLPAEARDGS